MDDEELLKTAQSAAEKAADYIREAYEQQFETEQKADGTSVTDADREAERIIREALAETSIPVVGEEHGGEPERTRKEAWVIDPIDGTHMFLNNKAESFCTMIGLVRDSKPIIGVVHLPMTDEKYWAVAGSGAYKDGERIRVSQKEALDGISASLSTNPEAQPQKKLYEKIGATFLQGGSFGVRVVRIAEGAAELAYEPRPYGSLWDFAAPAAILNEAGGEITRKDGTPFAYNETFRAKQGFLATNGALHQKAIQYFSER